MSTVNHGIRTANCHEEQLDERYRADNRAQGEHIGTKLAEIDAVIVPRRQTCRRSRSPRDRRATSNALQGCSTSGQKARWRSYGKERTARTHPHMRGTRESA